MLTLIKFMTSERAPQEGNNGIHFGSIAPSSEELRDWSVEMKCLAMVHGFLSETENFDFGVK